MDSPIQPVYLDHEFDWLLKERFVKDAIRDAAIDEYLNELKYILNATSSDDAASVYIERFLRAGRLESEFEAAARSRLLHNLALAEPSTGIVRSTEDNTLWLDVWGPEVIVLISKRLKSEKVNIDRLNNVPPFCRFLQRAVDLSKDDTWRTYPNFSVQSLRAMSEGQILSNLSTAVIGHKYNFACGGKILLESSKKGKSFGVHSFNDRSSPLTLRWDGVYCGTSQKLVFPIREEYFERSLWQLRVDCERLLSSYNEGVKMMVPAQFSTNFHPHDFGILEAISRSLDCEVFVGDVLCAILSELNVYSTPLETSYPSERSISTKGWHQDRIGTLIVCLPCAHDGGQLIIRHLGVATEFDWSDDQPNHITWAFFQTQCDNEILPIKAGHMITLTYDVIFTPMTRGPDKIPRSLGVKYHTLYKLIKGALQQPGFMTKGGIIGVYCNHQYGHTNSVPRYLLKGSDLILATIFKRLKIETGVQPILDDHAGLVNRLKGDREFQKLQTCQRHGFGDDDLSLEYDDRFYCRFPPATSFEERLKNILKWRKIEGMTGQEVGRAPGTRSNCVGDALGPAVIVEGTEQQEILKKWPHQYISGINWLNTTFTTEHQIIFNPTDDEEVEIFSSSVAILAIIPPWSSDQRGPTPSRSQKRWRNSSEECMDTEERSETDDSESDSEYDGEDEMSCSMEGSSETDDDEDGEEDGISRKTAEHSGTDFGKGDQGDIMSFTTAESLYRYANEAGKGNKMDSKAAEYSNKDQETYDGKDKTGNDTAERGIVEERSGTAEHGDTGSA